VDVIVDVAPTAVSLRPLRQDEIGTLARAIDDELTEAQVENRWREQELGYRELLVAEVDGSIVGTVSISDSIRPKNSLHLFALEVAPNMRGRGIGGAIVQSILAEARERGRARVYLEVRVDNPARRLYHRLGFRRTGPSFLNAWWRFESDGTRERVEETSYRMVKRIASRP
jgi:ribosomal protein S18 acetylase RimI-like enzyme